jgi:hypothetical protein
MVNRDGEPSVFLPLQHRLRSRGERADSPFMLCHELWSCQNHPGKGDPSTVSLQSCAYAGTF